ncbi:Chitin elicitor receptor kinase [Salvia divinorum]|uniref:Chitin elicitor receptor kinase n=1 Tax=Salvia divinorum TaxID=28513 RepID=A0ABD1IGQ1_SALDI
MPMKLLTGILLIAILSTSADARCSRGCDTALASYYMWLNSNLTFVSQMTQAEIPTILSYNPSIPNQDSVQAGARVNVPFACDCLEDGEFLGHMFEFRTFPGVTYQTIAQTYYSNLTTVDWLQRFNSYPAFSIPDTGVTLNVTVNCSCGDENVSKDYGLFVTWPLKEGETLESIADANNLSTGIVSRYNPSANFNSGNGLVYIPGKDQDGTFPPIASRTT